MLEASDPTKGNTGIFLYSPPVQSSFILEKVIKLFKSHTHHTYIRIYIYIYIYRERERDGGTSRQSD